MVAGWRQTESRNHSMVRPFGLFGHLGLIAEYYRPDLVLIPIGGHSVIDPKDAACATRHYLKPRFAIPINYGTNPMLEGTPQEYLDALGETSTQVPTLQPRRSAAPFRRRCALFALLTLFGLASEGATPASSDDDLVESLRGGGHVLLIRHAQAPGTGDPDGFQLSDCSTQRNLSDTGREQARGIGAWLRARGIRRGRVYSSQWCRCLETAELIGLGPVTELPALNSFYERPQHRELNLNALTRFPAAQPQTGIPLVLVTHQVTITALSGEFSASGHGVLMKVGGGGALRPVGVTGFGR